MTVPRKKDKFFALLKESIEERLPKTKAAALYRFAEKIYDTFPVDDLAGRKMIDMYGNTFGNFKFVQIYDPSRPKVRIFNPEYEQHGWQSSRTVVAILCTNMSFLRDSIRLEFIRRNITIHTINGTILHTLRKTSDHSLIKLLDGEETAKKGQVYGTEALLYMEISRHTDEAEIQDIVDSLQEVVADVKMVVDDYGAIKELLHTAIKDVKKTNAKHVRDSAEENAAFLDWLEQNNYTFLGAEQFEVSHKGGKATVSDVASGRLGLLKNRDTYGQIDLARELDKDFDDKDLYLQQLTFAKSSLRSRVHRQAYPQYIAVKRYNSKGAVVGQYRFLGMFTSSVYTTNNNQSIPIVRRKVEEVKARSGLAPDSHDGKSLDRVLETLPRDEVFQSNMDELFATAMAINELQERRKVKLLVRKGTYGKFFSCLVFTPRDVYRTELRREIESILCEGLGAVESDFTTYFSESILTRTHFTLRVDPEQKVDYDLSTLENEVVQATFTWVQRLSQALHEEFGEEEGNRLNTIYGDAFPPGYRHDFAPVVAVNDIKKIESLSDDNAIGMSFYQMLEESEDRMRFRLSHRDSPLPLSDIIPVLENLGLRVVSETPYEVVPCDGSSVYVHDFSLIYSLSSDIDILKAAVEFKEAFIRIWDGDAESDGFNKLILGTRLGWRDIAMLRAYARYMKQILFNYSEQYISEALSRYMPITLSIVDLFKHRFDPRLKLDDEQRAKKEAETEAVITKALEEVENLNDDQIIRKYVTLINATKRTNFYQTDDGYNKAYFSFKICPGEIPEIPKPAPMFEIFVYSPRVEGVHLRGGKVARGGLRWSDRQEDFRTEVLGLVKAQQVKNSVIVPVGAKGGFVAKTIPDGASRDEIMSEGIACYRIFIQALLDVTDNLVDGEVVPPKEVVRKDEDDTYLVVAADKGTATFSDIANEISQKNNFWLGDAFASGGSIGYDHKKMGITARGAWVSVQRHFRERGINVQTDDFTVIGVGDMAGDVFGNGMLLSEHIRLVAAFNHMHIFVDPDPVADKSFVERKRLFELPRSSWTDYDNKLISKGGGIFLRSAKSIKISPEMKARFDISEDSMTPNALIHAILKAPIDLFWNGGIGTYIKARSESHAEVGDKANDAVRVNGDELRCKVIGEGGNLGATQLGRVEFGLNGGASNTDFIDNAAGVDCSDHEVNIKILLNGIVANGDMTEKQRVKLLEEMTDCVSDLVLENNYRQTQAISIAEMDSVKRLGELRRLISRLESDDKLDRALEFLPDEEALGERKSFNQGLVRPELSVLISYVKGLLKDDLANSDVPDDKHMMAYVEDAFPPELRKRYKKQIYDHKLRREIIATQVANDMANHMGITFVDRMLQSTGEDCGSIAKAYVTAKDVFSILESWRAIEELDYVLDSKTQMKLMGELMRLCRRAARWFLRNRRRNLCPAVEIKGFQKNVRMINENLPTLLKGQLAGEWSDKRDSLIEMGVPESLALSVCGAGCLYSSLGIIEAAHQTEADVLHVAEIYFTLGERLELDWFSTQLANIKVENYWQAMAREAFMDDLEWQQRALTASVLQCMEGEDCVDSCIEKWYERHSAHVSRWHSTLSELHAADPDFAMFAVATRELLDLAQSSGHKDGQ